MDITIFVAIAGVVIACASLGWKVYDSFRDRAKIVIDYQKDMKSFNNPLYDSNKAYFVITVINKGNRPVRITKVGLKKRGKNGYILSSDSLCFPPRILTETDPSTCFLIEQSLMNFETIEYVWAQDATGKMYKRRFKTKL